MGFEPDYRHIVSAATNKRSDRLAVYEHIISPLIMEQVLDCKFAALQEGEGADLRDFFTNFCRFFKEMTFDTVSFELCITPILPGGGALLGGKAGPIQNRSDFESYPWDELAKRYWQAFDKQFTMLSECMPDGMKAIGGVGNGVLEISEDLVGLEYLAYMQVDDPQLFADLYNKIGDLMVQIWATFLERYAKDYAVCRFGDDLGFKSGTLVAPNTIRQHIIPQYRRVIKLVHDAGLPFLLHTCGNIFAVMDDIIDTGIDAKHSNEDVIAPFDKWIELYGSRIGLFGGIDVDLLCTLKPDETYQRIVESGTRFRKNANGYALGSGNSIPDYVPVENFLAMIRAVRQIRQQEDIS